MKKLLFIAPHLSTGGLPQYLSKKIEALKGLYDIYCVEYSNHSNSFVVQRNKIKNLIQDKYFLLEEDKTELLNIINRIKPNVVCLEEIPEYFLPNSIAEKIYDKKRDFSIIETTHDSSFDVNNKIFLPDKFFAISRFILDKFSKLGVPCELMEYPIEYKNNIDKASAKKRLGLDPNKKHVINVGLFTSRKNQAEIVDYAKNLKDFPIQFHFIGNQADNFKWYWEPLMKNFPKNCKWWGERSDVENFYEAADLFLFTSRGSDSDKETSPLVIREAIAYNLPSLIYNLPVYMGMYDEFENVKYLNFDSLEDNRNKILEIFDFQEKRLRTEDYIFAVSTYPKDISVEEKTVECLAALKKFNIPIILTSHAPVSKKLQELSDYLVYDKNNILTKHDFYSTAWWDNAEYRVDLNLKTSGNDTYHGPAVYSNYYNAICLAKGLARKKVICLNFDFVIDKADFINEIARASAGEKGYFCKTKDQEGEILKTVFHVIDSEFFLENFPLIKNDKDYLSWQKRIDSPSNGLENMYFNNLKKHLHSLHLVEMGEYEKRCFGCSKDSNSQVEYFSILPVKNKENFVAAFFNFPNEKDNRFLELTYKQNQFCKKIETKTSLAHFIEYKSGESFKILVKIYNVDKNGELLSQKEIEFNEEYRRGLNDKGHVSMK